MRDRFVLRAGPANERIARAQDDRRVRSGASGLRQLALQRPACIVRVGGDVAFAQVPEQRRDELARRVGSTATKTSTVSGSTVRCTTLLHRDQQPLDPCAEADPGRRRAADLLDEVVVAAATGEDRVLVLERPDELPGRAGVVVEPADERRDELVADAGCVEVGADRGEVLDAGRAEGVADRRRGLE